MGGFFGHSRAVVFFFLFLFWEMGGMRHAP